MYFYSSRAHLPHLHSFPTRRSSDLEPRRRVGVRALGGPGRGRHGVALSTREDGGAHHRHEGGHRRNRRGRVRSEEHTSELQSLTNLVCRLLLEKKNNNRSNLRTS